MSAGLIDDNNNIVVEMDTLNNNKFEQMLFNKMTILKKRDSGNSIG